MIPDVQTLILKSLMSDHIRPTLWDNEEEQDPEHAPGGVGMVMLHVPQPLLVARRVCKSWRAEVETYVLEETKRVIRLMRFLSVNKGIQLCHCDQYLDPRALPETSNYRISGYLGDFEIFGVSLLRQRLENGAHQLVVKCGVLDDAAEDGTRLSPSEIVPVPDVCLVLATEYTPQESAEYFLWEFTQRQRIARFLNQQYTALRAQAPLILN